MTTQSITYIKMPARSDGCWKVKGSSWPTLAGPWLIAHDLFHHAPGDTGSLAEELATIGAELYICHEDDGMAALPQDAWVEGTSLHRALIALSSNTVGIVGMPFDEGIADPALYDLATCQESATLSPALEYLLDCCARDAVSGLAEIVGRDEDWASARAAFTVDRVRALMRLGYHHAQMRFPDRVAVHDAFLTAKKTIANYGSAPEGTEITVHRSGLVVTIN